MMKRLWVCLLFTVLSGAAAADSIDVPQTDVTASYLKHDLAFLFRPQEPFLGFIDKNYQRLRIVLTAIRRDSKDRHIYRVVGYSQVKTNRCDFSGEIVIGKITVAPPQFSDDSYEADQIKERKIVSVGVIEARYALRENPTQIHTGVFEGNLKVTFDVDRSGKLIYDELADPEGGWDNNRYTGRWTPYGGKSAAKTANWGDQRIPESGDLDTGMHVFTPNKAYRQNGWEDYHSEDDVP